MTPRPISTCCTAVVAACLLSSCSVHSQRHSAVEEFSQSISAAGVDEIIVATRNGPIDVVCVENVDEITLSCTKYATSPTHSFAAVRAAKIEIRIEPPESSSGALRVEAEPPPGGFGGGSWGARFSLTVPTGLLLRLDTSNGRIQVQGLNSGVEASTRNGDVHVADVRGAVRLRTSNGATRVRRCRGDVDVETSNASIVLEDVAGGRIRAVTSNGAISAPSVTGDLVLRSTTASIDARVDKLSARPNIVVSTSNGSVDLTVPRTTDADVQLRTSNWRIRADLPPPHFGANTSRGHLNVRLGEGRGTIDVRSSNASIRFAATGGAPSPVRAPGDRDL